MPQNREAIDTIKGYYYQFDYFILKLLEEKNKDTYIYLEGIEDIDIEDIDSKKAIQCKYYDKTEYQHSVIKKPIIEMFKHYSENKQRNFQYYIYGHYKCGQEKLPDNFNIEFLKKNFLTYKKDNIKHKVFEELNISDAEIEKFKGKLKINISADSYEQQEKRIKTLIRKIYNCDDELSQYYYSNALAIVKLIATNSNIQKRKITPNQFVTMLKNNKEKVFNSLYIHKQGIEKYCRLIKKTYFSTLNISPYERFFLIECDQFISDEEIKGLVYQISKKWCNISKRNDKPYCPYILLYGVTESRLKKIKTNIQLERHNFIDGYDFKDADFCVQSLIRQADKENKIEFKIVNNIKELDKSIKQIDKTKEVYEFYLEKSFYQSKIDKCVEIKITSTLDVENMI
ncbi:MAG: hypothetical protein HFJ29_00760 [Clostridia bacterium]|nr:hypothetical protein [Clostridia bacterium]